MNINQEMKFNKIIIFSIGQPHIEIESRSEKSLDFVFY